MISQCLFWENLHVSLTEGVMVNVLCQLDWIMDGGIFDKTLFPGISVRVSPDEISIWIGGLRKAVCPPQMYEPHPVCWGPEWNKKEEEKRIWPFPPPHCLGWDTGLLFTSMLLVLWPLDTDSLISRAFLGAQVTNGSLWHFSASIIVWLCDCVSEVLRLNLFLYVYILVNTEGEWMQPLPGIFDMETFFACSP